ncbi:MAG: ABC transporter permease [Planctomycetaceae bacterium]|nr:ABC transporter permease [Planctomycetaceae bacterium]
MNESAVPSTTPRPAWLLPIWSLAQREIVRFLRQRSRLIGAIGQPLIFWILFGAGLHGTFQLQGTSANDVSFQEYFLPGVAIMIVLFTSIFASISVIQDRHEGFLQGVLVSPVPRSSIVLGKVLGGTLLALVQSALFLVLAPVLQLVGLAPAIQLNLTLAGTSGALLFLTLVAIGLNSLGYLFAWKIDSVQGYHGIMSVVLLPMWLMSGAFFPGDQSPWLRVVMRLNPLTYGVAGLRQCVSSNPNVVGDLPSIPLCLAVLFLFSFICLAADVWLTRRDQGV